MATFPVLTDNYLHLIFELDNPLVPVNLLAWAVEAFVTSSACLMDVWSWDDRSSSVFTTGRRYNKPVKRGFQSGSVLKA